MPPELSLEDIAPNARAVLVQATQEATKRASVLVDPLHILLALVDGRSTVAIQQLAKVGVDTHQLRDSVTAALASNSTVPQFIPTRSTEMPDTPVLSNNAQRVIRSAFKEAAHLGHKSVDTIHLLLGLLYLDGEPAATLLTKAGISLYQLRQTVLEAPPSIQPATRHTLRAAIKPSPIFFALIIVMIAAGVGLWRNPSESWVGPLTTLFVISGWIVSLCLHEFSHALAAYLGGDSSVREAGYLTLNPLRYTHPLLSIIMPVIFLLMGGIGLPGGAVYINTNALRNTRWEALVSAAGPLGTLIFCVIISIPFYFDWQAWTTAENWYLWPALAFLGFLQVTALLFNLLPIPPLDGFQLLATQLPSAIRRQLLGFGNIGFFLLLFLFSRNNPVSEGFWRFAFLTAARLQIPVELVSAGYQQFSWWSF